MSLGEGVVRLSRPGAQVAVGAGVELGIRPEHALLVQPDAPEALLAGTVRLVERLGNQTLVHLDTGAGAFTLQGPGHLKVRIGDRAGLALDLAQAHLFGADQAAI